MENEARLALDMLMIQNLLNRYMQAVDLKDVHTLKSAIFTPDASIEVVEALSVDGFCHFVSVLLETVPTQHFLANSVIDVDGDCASARTYFIGYHRIPAGDLGSATALFAERDAPYDSIIGGVATDTLSRTGEGWRIAHRKIKPVWQKEADGADLMAQDWLK